MLMNGKVLYRAQVMPVTMTGFLLVLQVIFPLVNTASCVDELRSKTKDDTQCDSGSSLVI